MSVIKQKIGVNVVKVIHKVIVVHAGGQRAEAARVTTHIVIEAIKVAMKWLGYDDYANKLGFSAQQVRPHSSEGATRAPGRAQDITWCWDWQRSSDACTRREPRVGGHQHSRGLLR